MLLFFTLISYFFLPDNYERRSTSTSLINKKTRLNTERIVLSKSGENFEINLEKKNGSWYLRLDDTLLYPAQNLKINHLLEELNQKRKVYIIPSKKNIYELDEKDYHSIHLYNKDQLIDTTIKFGSISASGMEQYVQTNKNIFRISNEFSSYLDLQTASWCELSIFSSVLNHTDIQSVRYEDRKKSKIYIAGSNPEIENLKTVLKSLRCIDITNIPVQPNIKLSLELGNTQVERYGITELNETVSILSNETTGISYIISRLTMNDILKALGI